MTYIYSRPSFELAAKPKTLKIGAIALMSAILVTAVLMLAAPKSKPSPLATQPMTLELAGAPVETAINAKTPNALSYSAIDSVIRDVQIDNAHIGHSMKMALISDKNPIKRVFIYVERKFSLMGILVGLAFIYTLISFGFVRTSKDDLSNY